MKTNMIDTNSVMKNAVKYICLFLMLFGMSFSQKAWAGMYLEYGGKTYNPGDELIFYVDLAGEDIVEGYLDNIELKNSSGWTYSSGTCASGKNYGYMEATCSANDNIYVSSFSAGCYNSQYGTQSLQLGYMSNAEGNYDCTITINQRQYFGGSVLQTGSFYIRVICYDSSAPAKTVSFSVGYGNAPSNESGTSITLPAIPSVCDAAAAAGWAPYGWATAAVAANSTSVSGFVGRPGDTYYPDANRTLYAVYKKGSTLSSANYNLVTASNSTSNMPSDGYVTLTNNTSSSNHISNTLTTSGSTNYWISQIGSSNGASWNASPKNYMTVTNAACVWEIISFYDETDSKTYYKFRNLDNNTYVALGSTLSSGGDNYAHGALLTDGSNTKAHWEIDKAYATGFRFKNRGTGYYLYLGTNGYRGKEVVPNNESAYAIVICRKADEPASSGAKYQSALSDCGYQVTYNGNGKNGGGNPPTDNTVYTSGATVTVLGNSNSMTKTGYTFSGWNTSPDGNGTDRAASSTFSITSDVTLYAKWVAKEYTVNLNKDGGSGGSTSVTATYDAAMPSAGSAPTFSGYDFGGYYAEVGGGGTQYYTNAPASAHVWDVDVNPSTIYAKWTQVVKLDKNEGSADGSVTVTYHGNGTSSFTGVTRTGYTCKGYFDATSGGHKVLNADGTLVSYSTDVSGYINSSGQWIHAGATTLYAQWEAKEYTITLNQNGGSDGAGSVTVTFGEGMPSATMPTAPTGYTFVGYFYEETKYYNADGSSAHEWNIDDNVTLVASYTTNTPDLTVSSTDHVTITATPSGGSTIAEGLHNTVAYNTTITIANSDLESGYYWAGWDVYETGNSSNKVAVSSNSFAMPNHNVTVSAIVYPEGNIKAWCPVITLTKTDGAVSPILITSVSGQAIKAVRTLHLTVTGAPTIASVVTLSGNDLKFYADFSGTVKEITSENKLTCSSYALDKTIYVAYSPTGTYANDSWNSVSISAACLNSNGSEASSIEVEDLVNVRRLPDNGTGSGQGFVIAAKVGGQWVAMPSSIIAGAQDGLPITVNENEDPSSATLAPSSARYNLYNVYTSTRTNDRHKQYGDYAYLAGKGTKALKAAPSGVNISLGVNISTYTGGSEDAAYFEWLLSTTDKKNYTITNNARTPDKLKYYTTHDKFGMYSYNSQVITEFRLLPATFYEEAPMQVVEWKTNSIVVMYTGSETTATTKVGNNDPSSSQTLANNKLTHGIYELTTDQTLTSNDGAALEISFGDGSTRKIVEVPIIITGNSTATDGHAAQDVVICNGGKLTAVTTSYDYYNIYVYGGGKLDIPIGTSLSVNNIILRAGGLSTSGIGSSPSVTYQYVYPQVGLIGTLTSAEANIQYEYITDYNHWYHFCLPFDGTLSTIHYPMEYYGDNVTENNTGSWIVKRYAGEVRATGRYDAWKDIETEGATAVTAGHGYIYWGAPKKVGIGGATKIRQQWGIQRITMTKAAETAKGEENANKTISGLGSYSGVSDNSGKVNDQGWNLIGNPYMVNLSGLSSTSLKTGKLIEELDPVTKKWTGRWISNNDGLRYITVPSDHFDTYDPVKVTDATVTLVAGRAFFVQLEGDATAVQFETAKRTALMPAWERRAEEHTADVETGIVLSDESKHDEVNFWIKDGKTEAYEYNADYPKMMNTTNFNIYGVHSNGELSWVAISPEIAEGSMAIGYQVPAAGDYMLSLSETYVSDEIEHVFVTDHGVSPEVTTDLMEEDYNFYVNQAETNDVRFTVAFKLKEEDPGTVTSVENATSVDSDKPLKFIYNDKMYILRNGIIYDAVGKRVSIIKR